MTPPPVLIYVRRGEAAAKCTIRPLRGTPGLVFHSWPPRPDALPPPSAVVLAPGATPLSAADASSPLVLLDASWRHAEKMLRLLQRLGPIPCWTPGDDEIYLKTGLADGFRVFALTDLSLDDVDAPRIAGLATPPAVLERLAPSGDWERIETAWDESRRELLLPFPLRPLHPVVLRTPVGGFPLA